MFDGDDGKGGAKDTGDDDKKFASAEDLKTISDNVGKLADTVTKVLDANKATSEQVKNFMEAMQAKGGDDDDDDDDKNRGPSAQDLETMSRAEFKQAIIKEVSGEVSKQIKTLEKNLKDLDTKSSQEAINNELKEAQANHPDWDFMKEKIAEVAKDNPYLSFEDMYILARTKNPDLAKQADEKFKLRDGKPTDEAGGQENKGGKGGKPPFSGQKSGSGTKTEETGKMSKKEAGEKAYEDIMGGIDLGENVNTQMT